MDQPGIPEFIAALDKMKEVHISKNADYANKENLYFNFDVQEYIISLFKNPEDKPYASMVAIKIARLSELLNKTYENPKHIPNNESIDDSFIDLANYALLWKCNRMARLVAKKEIGPGFIINKDNPDPKFPD